MNVARCEWGGVDAELKHEGWGAKPVSLPHWGLMRLEHPLARRQVPKHPIVTGRAWEGLGGCGGQAALMSVWWGFDPASPFAAPGAPPHTQ